MLQYEIVTGPLAPLEAADALAHTRETIYNVASIHGMKATCLPKIGPNEGTRTPFSLILGYRRGN
jgi:glutamine synthetase